MTRPLARSFETVLADDFGNLERVVFVPLLAAVALRDAVADVLTPALEGLFVLPPHHGQPLTVVRLERLDVDEAGMVLARFSISTAIAS